MRFLLLLAGLLILALALSVAFGETALSGAQYAQGLADPASPAGTILFAIRAPRAAAAALTGGALGLAGAVMQGLLRNPLAEPGVLGVSAWSGFAAALAIALGLGAAPGVTELAALAGALAAGAIIALLGRALPRAGDADPVRRGAGGARRRADLAHLQPVAVADHLRRDDDLAAWARSPTATGPTSARR